MEQFAIRLTLNLIFLWLNFSSKDGMKLAFAFGRKIVKWDSISCSWKEHLHQDPAFLCRLKVELILHYREITRNLHASRIFHPRDRLLKIVPTIILEKDRFFISTEEFDIRVKTCTEFWKIEEFIKFTLKNYKKGRKNNWFVETSMYLWAFCQSF